MSPKGPPIAHTVKAEWSGAYDGNVSAFDAQGRKIGFIWLTRDNEAPKHVSVNKSFVEAHARGRGVGASMYLAAHSLARSSGLTLRSDVDLSADAHRLWGSLVRKGLATRTPGRMVAGQEVGARYEMKPSGSAATARTRSGAQARSAANAKKESGWDKWNAKKGRK